jgi:hypothetical protein
MAQKTSQIPESQPQESVYTDGEMAECLWLQSLVYALDDAIESQTQLHRPQGFVTPLQQLRQMHAQRLVDITKKGNPEIASEKPT